MKALFTWMCTLGLLATLNFAHASLPANADLGSPTVTLRPQTGGSLDDCRFDFIGFTTGTHSGSMLWPSHSGGYYMTGYRFLNTCMPGETLFVYCIDLDHDLNQNPYCGSLQTLSVRNDFREQYPAMAYALTWFHPTTAIDDRIQQLALWKMVSDQRNNSATNGTPYYRVIDGRGWPNLSDTPVYPYVNTVYNNDPAVNTPANDRVRFLLGATDGIPKNVIHCSDTIHTEYTTLPSDDDEVITTVITISIARGPDAIAVNNLATGGIRLQLETDLGSLSATEVFTNNDGIAEVTLTEPAGTTTDATVRICTRGMWLKTIRPCATNTSQISVLQAHGANDICTVCTSVIIPADFQLPVELASFNASASAASIELAWRTASEVNLARWEIERRADGEAYGLLSTLPAANLASGQSYRYVDTDVEADRNYQYRLVDVSVNGVRTTHDSWARSAGISSQSAVTQDYVLGANFPNPFNPATHIAFTLPEAGQATLTVFDITGQVVAVLVNGRLGAGEHTADFVAGAMPSGVYFYRLQCGSFSQTKKMILMK